MRCNNCGWENPDGNQKCEKCNAPLQGGGVSAPNARIESTVMEDTPFSKPKSPISRGDTIPDGTIPDLPKSTPNNGPKPVGSTSGTINFWGPVGAGTGAPISHIHCILKPVIFPGEDTRFAPKPVEINGDYNELNRQSLDPDNKTITSKVQAILTNKDGKWYIQDQSTQQTTYVHAGEPIEVKTGDIILMGNRTFVFDED